MLLGVVCRTHFCHTTPLLFNVLSRPVFAAARVVGATMMWGIGGKLKKKYGVEGDVRQALYKVRGWRGMWN